MGMDDYRDSYWAGRLADILPEFQKKLHLIRITGKTIGPDGSVIEMKKKYIIYGSLQTWRKKRNYSDDSFHSSSRTGKLLVSYRYKIKEGDIVQKDDTFYRVTDKNDFDYAEVHDFEVERMGLDEIQRYDFDSYLEEEFPDPEEKKGGFFR